MTQEDKELLLKDLCTRLPYRVKIMRYVERNNKINELIPELNISIRLVELFIGNNEFIIKPYLRPMSNMTEEEFLEYRRIKYNNVTYRDKWKRIDVGKYHSVGIIPIDEYLDWLNAHHFDYRDLIKKGLALEAPKDMYN